MYERVNRYGSRGICAIMKLKEMFKNNRSSAAGVGKKTQITEAPRKPVKKTEDASVNISARDTTDYDDWLDGYKLRNPASHNKIAGLE
jgi:hypothetical protein